jgi:transposase
MRALEPEVVDAVWRAVEGLIPAPIDGHPLGCHRLRAPDRLCFEGILLRLVTGCAWVDVERMLGGVVSDTTLRARCDEWVDAGVFDRLATEAVEAYDRVIGLDFADCTVDGSQHKAPAGGEGTGPSPVDRGKREWKWSLFADSNGIPVAWIAAAANRNDCVLLEPTLTAADARGVLAECETLHLDRGYDNPVVRRLVASLGIELICSKVRARAATRRRDKKVVPLGLRWPIERTNSWLSNFGQLRRNTDRSIRHRLAQISLAVALLLTAKLIDWRDRWSPA